MRTELAEKIADYATILQEKDRKYPVILWINEAGELWIDTDCTAGAEGYAFVAKVEAHETLMRDQLVKQVLGVIDELAMASFFERDLAKKIIEDF